MSRQIWMLSWHNCNNVKGTSFICLRTFSTAPGSCGVVLIYDGVNTGIGQISAFASVVATADRSQCPAGFPFWSDESAGCVPTSVPPDQPFDCINGGCVAKTTYNTPGVFANLAACRSGCAKNSNCAGECVSPAQIAALQSATNNLISRYCK